MRSIIIGDIHGCSSQLQGLLEQVGPDPARDRLILLGDLFDRGPDSWSVLQMVKRLAEEFGDRFVLLRGNHEDYLLTPKLSPVMRMVWERVGRGTTVRSFQEHGEKMEDCAGWIGAQSVLYYKGPDFWCVHAGLRVEPPEVNDLQTLLHDHDVVLENRYAGPLTVTGHIALDKATYFGGDMETLLEYDEGIWYPLPEHGIICIDTGCGKGGTLTAMVVRDGRFILYGQKP